MRGRLEEAVTEVFWTAFSSLLAEGDSPNLGGDLKLALSVGHSYTVFAQLTLREKEM